MEGKSGQRIVLILLGALAAVVVVVLTGFVLFEPERQPCATGEMADNEFVNGAYVPRRETFTNIEDAEAFICHAMPELHAEGWELETISAERSHALAETVNGNGTAIVTLEYRNESLNRTLVFDATPFFTDGGIPRPFTEKDVTFGDYRGKLIRGGINPNLATVIWTDDGLQLRAVVQTDASFTETDLLTVLATAR